MQLLAEIRSRFAAALEPLVEGDVRPFVEMVKPAQDARFGDFQANSAMPLAKKLGKPPRDVAAEIVERLDLGEMCDPPEIAGPGFVNVRLNDDWLAARVNELVGDDRLGVEPAAEPRQVVVDFSAPNVAKPMHVGHLRSTVIGHALVRILRFLGHQVTGDNHIGDWGTQFGMIIYGWKNLRGQGSGVSGQDDAATVEELASLYRLVNRIEGYQAAVAKLPELEAVVERERAALAEAEAAAAPDDKAAKKQLKKLRKSVESAESAVKSIRETIAAGDADAEFKSLVEANPNTAELARQETAKLHVGDAENQELWDRFLPVCLDMLNRMYDRLGVEFDETLGESFYQPMLAGVVADLEAKGLASESDGAIVVVNEGFKAPFLVRKSDGAFMYATTDLATIAHRIDEWQTDEVLYVVDNRQSEHFEQLFATAARWRPDELPRMQHVKFGTILGKDGKPYKTRSGDTVGLESLLDESVSRALAIVSENDDAKPNGPELSAEERARVAEAVGIGGVKYFDLNHNRESDYTFDYETMLNPRGDTATYMQYAYARVHGIVRRGEVDPVELRASGKPVTLDAPAERALGLHLFRFADALDAVVQDYRPNLLTSYLFELANHFSTFYEQCPVLKAETEELKTSRLLLCDLTARVIERGLDLLGIQTCERM